MLAGATLLFGVTLNRRTASLIGLLLAVGGAPGAAGGARAQATGPDSEAPGHRRTAAEKAWDRGDLSRARAGYLAELAAHRHADSAWFNAGTAALAAGDVENARAGLAHAAASLDPELRFRALFNLGLLELRVAGVDSTNRDTHLADAERAYREALLLKPHHQAAKWNLELAIRRHSGGGASNNTPPSGGGGAQGKPQQGAGGGGGREDQGVNGGGGQLSQSQAEEILQSIGEEELRTRRDKSGRVRRAVDPRVKDW